MAYLPQIGFEPITNRLKVDCSTIELLKLDLTHLIRYDLSLIRLFYAMLSDLNFTLETSEANTKKIFNIAGDNGGGMV